MTELLSVVHVQGKNDKLAIFMQIQLNSNNFEIVWMKKLSDSE